MTLPSAERDLLMAEASSSRPAGFVAFCRSDPAKSTRCSVEKRCRHAAPGWALRLDSSDTVNTACERLDSRFILGRSRRLRAPLCDPRVKTSYVSSALHTAASRRPSTNAPRRSCSRIVGAARPDCPGCPSALQLRGVHQEIRHLLVVNLEVRALDGVRRLLPRVGSVVLDALEHALEDARDEAEFALARAVGIPLARLGIPGRSMVNVLPAPVWPYAIRQPL